MNQTHKISINRLAPGSTYDVIVGQELLGNIAEYIDLAPYSAIAVLYDQNVTPWCTRLVATLPSGTNRIEVNLSEADKSLKSAEYLWHEFLRCKLDRHSLLINLGGGVLSDVGGLAASLYMRGIAYLNIPTTLLAQVDAGIGGKVGVNFAAQKNLIGVISPPKLIVNDVETLTTLPKREFVSGLAEVLKHALIRRLELFDWVVAKSQGAWTSVDLIQLVSESVAIKAAIVAADEHEAGLRRVLNFGHTIGHALEMLSEGQLLHGEAIALGLLAEAKISQSLKFISADDVDYIRRGFESVGLPTKYKDLDIAATLELMRHDKKIIGAKLQWSLLKHLGVGVHGIEVSDQIVRASLQSLVDPA